MIKHHTRLLKANKVHRCIYAIILAVYASVIVLRELQRAAYGTLHVLKSVVC